MIAIGKAEAKIEFMVELREEYVMHLGTMVNVNMFVEYLRIYFSTYYPKMGVAVHNESSKASYADHSIPSLIVFKQYLAASIQLDNSLRMTSITGAFKFAKDRVESDKSHV